MTISTPVPDVGTPIFDASGFIDPVWHLFFQTLLRRTGGSEGIDANLETLRIGRNEQRITDSEAQSGSMVPAPARLPEQYESPEVFTHGIQQDPALHALATPTLDGFMSAADKAKLNGMGTYEAGTWTPALTFTVPGDLAIAYTTQIGTYVKIGNMVVVHFYLVTASFTYTTASGELIIAGVPFPNSSDSQFIGALNFEGLTRLGYTQFVTSLFPQSSIIKLVANASGMLSAASDTTTAISGGNLALAGSISYFVEVAP